MPLSKQVLAECEMIDARFRYIRRELIFPMASDAFGNNSYSLSFGGGDEIIAELETYKVRLENILGDTDNKEQDHLLKIR